MSMFTRPFSFIFSTLDSNWQDPYFGTSSTPTPDSYPQLDVFTHLGEAEKLFFFLPEMFLAFSITALLLVGAIEIICKKDFKLTAVVIWRGACLCLSAVVGLYTVQLLGNIPSFPAFSGYLFISSGITLSKLLVAACALIVLYCSESYIREHRKHLFELPLIILLTVLLLLFLVAANNLMTLFLSIAGFSLAMYISILFDGYAFSSREAGIKYFYLSAISTGILLFGIFLIYRTVGSADYNQISIFFDNMPFKRLENVDARCVIAGLVFIFFGFMFKLSAFPGHLWAVEVYEGSPAPITALFILPVKVAVFIAVARLFNIAFDGLSHLWSPLLVLAAVGSLLWGAVAAVNARKLTRFLGYTSINQIGFLLLGLSLTRPDALGATYIYLVVYAIMTGGFLVVFLQTRRLDGHNLLFLSDFAGISPHETLVRWHLAIYLFSMAGIPPLGGFFVKYYLFQAAMLEHSFGLLLIGLATSLVSAYYYLRIIKAFWFEEAKPNKKKEIVVLHLTSTHRILLSFLEALLWTLPLYTFFFTNLADEAICTFLLTR